MQNDRQPELIIIFTRYPVAGRTKTRLIPLLGSDGAADLQRRMTENALGQVAQLCRRRPVSVQVWHEGGNPALMKAWLGPGPAYRPQGPGDLGQKMDRAFRAAFSEGRPRVVLLGTDCPALVATIMAKALDLLKQVDVVLGPAADGGYYLIGLRRPASRLFGDIPWGTELVLARTVARAESLGLATAFLEELNDVDRPADLADFHNYSRP